MTKEVQQVMIYSVIGLAEENGLTEIMRRYHAELQILHNAAKEKGEKDEAAFILALGLFSLEVEQ